MVKRPLVAREEEKFVFLDRTAHGPAELVEYQFRLVANVGVSAVEKHRPCRQMVIAVVLEHRAVEGIRAALRFNVDGGPARKTLFCVEIIGDYVDFLNGFERRD